MEARDFNPELLPDINEAAAGQDLAVWIYESSQEYYLLQLLDTSAIGGKRREMMSRDIQGQLTEDEYYTIRQELQDNQLDRITNGFPYSMRDILKHLKLLR
jgi:hypothetical protein